MNNDELIGKKFGAWIVLEKAESIKYSNSTVIRYKCQCECGKISIVKKQALLRGTSKSCGCLRAKYCHDANTKHGMSYSKIYTAYKHMKDRCLNSNNKEYRRYGGRGISICDEWLGDNGFDNFYNWSIKNGYSEQLTIDRINNDGNYEPNNCRWTTVKQQNHNTSQNRLLTYNGETHDVTEWAELLNIERGTIFARIKYGMPIEQILFKKPTKNKKVEIYKDGKLIDTFNSQKEAANFIGVTPSTISGYLNRGVKNPDGYVFKYAYEETLGVNLASDNQYAERIS